MPEQEKIQVPEAPRATGTLAPLPESVRKAWSAAYEKSYRQSTIDSPQEASVHAQKATKAANAVLAVEKPASYEDAKAMPEWQLVKRSEQRGIVQADGTFRPTEDGELFLVVVTIEARGAERGDSKFVFPVPKPKAAAKKDEEKKSA